MAIRKYTVMPAYFENESPFLLGVAAYSTNRSYDSCSLTDPKQIREWQQGWKYEQDQYRLRVEQQQEIEAGEALRQVAVGAVATLLFLSAPLLFGYLLGRLFR